MYALISSTESVSCVTGWSGNEPIYTVLPNSYRVAEVATAEFPVYQTLFWVSCEDTVVADQFYYDSASQQILPIPEAPPQPAPVQPTTTGTQTL